MKRKIKWDMILMFILLCIFSIGLIISIINIIRWKIDSDKTNKQLDNINDVINIKEVQDQDSEIEIINPDENISKDNPYWDYIKMNLIDVDFKQLKDTNKDVLGWIQVNGTNINYPFVRTDDNEYYLTHSFNKTYNIDGWVFMDYRNSIESFDTNTIIYAHGLRNRTMFGSLKDIFTNGWLNDTNNRIIKLSTEYENTLWQIFSVYHIPTTSDYLKTTFNSNDDYQSFLDLIANRTMFNFNTTVNTNDKIITLSTCFNKEEKVVIHAKLIKKETR